MTSRRSSVLTSPHSISSGNQIPRFRWSICRLPFVRRTMPLPTMPVIGAVAHDHLDERRQRRQRASSVFKISGLPWHSSASSSASMKHAASVVIDTRLDNTRREDQSSTPPG